MKTYSTRERVLFALGIPLCLAVVAFAGFMLVTDRGATRYVPLWLAGLGGIGGTFVCLKIAISGRATTYLEQDVRRLFSSPDDPGSGGGAA